MQHVEAAVRRVQNQTIDGDQIDWRAWLKPSDKAKVIPAESLAEQGKERILLGQDYTEGLRLPWDKTDGRVLIRPGKVAVWSGWSHHGKTAMLKQVMLHAIASGERVLIASMEEEPHDLWTDLAHVYCGVTDPTPRALDGFVQFITGRLWIYDQQGMMESQRMVAVIRYAATELGVSQAMIDSLMMLSVDRDDYNAQSRFVGELKSAAKDTQCTAHLVTHMRKREGKSGDDQPGTMHDVAGGHEITSKCDYAFNVFRKKNKADGDDNPDCILGVEKQRQRRPHNWIGRIGLYYHPSGQFVERPGQAIRFQGSSVQEV